MTTTRPLGLILQIGAAAAAAIVLALAAPDADAAGGKGFTYGNYGHDATLGIDHLGIAGSGNPYVGDTQCTLKRPVLCVDIDDSPRPNYPVAHGQAFYQGWIGGHFATTVPVKGTTLTSAAAADGQCASAFGTGWRMAEFHDGAYVNGMGVSAYYGNSTNSLTIWPVGPNPHGGHTAWGFGHVRDDTRYWVNVNDQPGNCWNP